MKAKNTRSHLKTFSLSLSLGLSLIPSLSLAVSAQPGIFGAWEIGQAFSPPNRGAPYSSAGGGARSDCVKSDAENGQPLTALLPGNSLALTATEEPTLYVYVPETKARTAEFLLRDEEGNDLYRVTVSIPSNSGIVGFKLPKTESKTLLETGKDYHWLFALICKPEDRREDIFVDGWIQRLEPDRTLASELQKVKPEDRAGVYAKAGIWYEAVDELANLRRTRPDDRAIAANWEALLKSVGLEKIVSQPVLELPPLS